MQLNIIIPQSQEEVKMLLKVALKATITKV